MYLDLFSEETPCGSIVNCKGPPPVRDHSVFAFWVVAKSLTYGGGSTVLDGTGLLQ